MTYIPPEQRRTGRRSSRHVETAPEVVQEHQRKISVANIFFAILLLSLVVLAALIGPKEAVTQAFYTIGTENNLVNGDQQLTVGEYEGLVISELMPSNKSAVPDERGEYVDWIELWNSSDRPISLKEVGLSDRGDSIRFLFPEVVLQPDERVIVFCSDKNQAAPGLTYHAKFKLSSVGETVYLFDRNAYLIDSVKLPIMSSDESYALQADGSFAATKEFSPGYANSTEGHQTYLAATMVTNGALIISEIAPDPITGYRDANGELHDWIELYNTTDQPISLDNYALSNNQSKPLKWRFPTGAVVAPHGYYLVYCSGYDIRDDVTAIPHANFRISAEHDVIVLADSHGRVVERVVIDNIPEDSSWARNEDGTYSVHTICTPALPNNESGRNTFDYHLRALNGTGVYISEVMASNDSTALSSGSTVFTDWIEIYNSSSVTFDLSGYGLSDNLGRPRKWQFPQGTYIAPGEYKLIRCDGDVEKSNVAELHTSYSLFRDGGEVVCLSDPTGRVLDKVVMPLVPTNVSYGRTTGLSGFFYYDAPTPGQANGQGFLGYAPMPELRLEAGMYYSMVRTGFTVPEGTTVYYTTDGSIPTKEGGKAYNGENIELNFTTVLRARAFPVDLRYEPSEIATGTYFINAYHTLPVVSVTIDPWELWNPLTGMLTLGENVVKVAGQLPFKNTVYRAHGKEAREGYVEVYAVDGTQMISQGVAMGLIGDYSLDMPQKSMKFRAKSLYGDNTFEAALFDDRPFTEYKSFVLRNSGNDCMFTRLVDGFQSRLLDAYGTQVLHQAWNPVAVYINGAYWGHFNMRERVDRFFVAQHEGLSLDQASEMDILEGSGTSSRSISYGSNKEYKAMLEKIKAGDPANNPEDLKYLEDNIDIENHLEYMALEMFVGNSDIGNTRFYRLHEEGSKWKWIWYDADYGLWDSGFNSPWSYTKERGMGEKYIDNTIFLKELSVPKYRDMFLRKLGDIFQTFTTEFMLSVLEPLVEQIEPEMSLHWARWGEENDKFVISDVPVTVDGAYRYWEQRVDRLRNVIKKRPNILWGYIQEEFELSDAEMLDYFGPRPEMPADALL